MRCADADLIWHGFMVGRYGISHSLRNLRIVNYCLSNLEYCRVLKKMYTACLLRIYCILSIFSAVEYYCQRVNVLCHLFYDNLLYMSNLIFKNILCD